MQGTETLSPPEPERFHWIGRAGCAFFRKSFVIRSIRVSTMGLPSARASLSRRLTKEFATPSLSSQLNRSAQNNRRSSVGWFGGQTQSGCSVSLLFDMTPPSSVWFGPTLYRVNVPSVLSR